MGVDVDVERQLPLGLRTSSRSVPTRDAGVGEEQVDRAERLLGRRDQLLVAGLGADVGGDADRAAGPGLVELLDDGGERRRCRGRTATTRAPSRVESPGQRPPDAVGGTGDNDMTSIEFHRPRW